MEILEIRKSVNNGIPITYSAHCLKRMLERDISRRDILECIETGEIIEENTLSESNKSEKSLPSYLILGKRTSDNQAIHVLVGYNAERILIISVCYPDAEHWMSDNKTRRRK